MLFINMYLYVGVTYCFELAALRLLVDKEAKDFLFFVSKFDLVAIIHVAFVSN